jgi:hypothetical protein
MVASMTMPRGKSIRANGKGHAQFSILIHRSLSSSPPRESPPLAKVTTTVLKNVVETSHELKLETLTKFAHFFRIATAA